MGIYLESLCELGLKQVELIISDGSSGLKAARQSVIPSVLWQRHFSNLIQNTQSKLASIKQRKSIANEMRPMEISPPRNILRQPNHNEQKMEL